MDYKNLNLLNIVVQLRGQEIHGAMRLDFIDLTVIDSS